MAASAALACQSLATLSANPRSGPVGTNVTLTGANYSGSSTASNVDIHVDSRSGPIVASTRADASGKINVTFSVPGEMTSGYHTLLATQTVNGVPKSGTPGRTSFQVTGTSASSSASADPSSLSTPVGLGALVLVGIVGLIISRRRRATTTPVA